MSLNRINSQYFNYIDKNTGYIFNFREGEIGIYGAGRCWRLSLIANGCEAVIGAFVTKDDNHSCYRNCIGKKIWNDNDARITAELMIDRMLNPISKTTPIVAVNDAIDIAIKRIAELSDTNIPAVITENDEYTALISNIRQYIINSLTSMGGKFNF